MKRKIFLQVFLGLKGICFNSNLTSYQKIALYFDDIKFLFLLIPVYFFKYEIHRVKIKSFGYTVFFKNYITFFYIFNEIFCKEIYVPMRISKYFDLGANIGLSILWYKFFNPDLIVTAFEPDKVSYTYLRKNIAINHLKGIRTYRLALSNKKGIARFYSIRDDVQNLDSGLTLNQKLPYNSYFVKTDTLSSYIHTKVDLLKIDIEGGEYDVIDDLIKSSKIKLVKHLICEMHFFNEAERVKSDVILEKLKKIGTVDQSTNSSRTKVFLFQVV